jgi:peptidoglycan/xylan/chitin deacetylase (PgdA/CDA1 family)
LKSTLIQLAASEVVLRHVRRRVARSGVTVFVYHDVGADEAVDDAWQIVRRRDFAAQVGHLLQHYEIVDLDTALHTLGEPAGRPGRPQAVLTFDDGLRGNHDHLLPMIEQLRVPVTIYVATGHVENQQGYWFDRVANALQPGFEGHIDLGRHGLGRYTISGAPGARRWSQVQRILVAAKSLDEARCIAVADLVEAQVRAQAPAARTGMADVLAPMTVDMLRAVAGHPLVTLGVHTHGHELLPMLEPALARRTVVDAQDHIQRWTGVRARHFAYPAGRSHAASRQLVAGLGFVTAVGTQPGVWTRAVDPMNIPRMSVGRYDSLATFKLNAVGGLGRVLGRSSGQGPETL